MGGGEQEIKIEREQEDVVKGLVTFWHRLSMVYNREEVKGILGRGSWSSYAFPTWSWEQCVQYMLKRSDTRHRVLREALKPNLELWQYRQI